MVVIETNIIIMVVIETNIIIMVVIETNITRFGNHKHLYGKKPHSGPLGAQIVMIHRLENGFGQ